MAVAAIVFVGDIGKLAHLPRRQRAIGDGHAQHIGVKLQIQAVHQSERTEFVLVQLAGEPSFHLAAELADALAHELMVEIVIPIHEQPLGRHWMISASRRQAAARQPRKTAGHERAASPGNG